MLTSDYNRTSNVFVDVNGGVKNLNYKLPLILDKYNSRIVMQKLKFKQEFTFAIIVECLQINDCLLNTTSYGPIHQIPLYRVTDFPLALFAKSSLYIILI